MFSQEIIDTYALGDISDCDSELDYYYSFLAKTDHIPNKIIESLIENLADATALNFITVFIQFIADVRIHYNDVLKARKQAREEINRLGGETVPEPTGTTEGETT